MSRMQWVLLRHIDVQVWGLSFALFSLVVLVSSVVSAQSNGGSSSPNLTELSDGWRLASADEVQLDDAVVSSPTFDASH